MEDKLKGFVNEHRDEFDVFEPRQELWQEICQEIPPLRKEVKVISFNYGERLKFSADFMFMRIAAAALLLLGCGLTFLAAKKSSSGSDGAMAVATATEAPALNTIAPEMIEVEAYYTSQINSKKSQLSNYDVKVLGLDEQQSIDRELMRLDSTYGQLKKQLYTTPNKDLVIDAMIQNLQIRIEVLNRQLEVLQKIERLQQNETTDTKHDETATIL
ncbi:hypothetical protein [Pontibacter harenae]|uniref:hypothetical protein n=1 Tax=Pontibacter harenae TaxID=2894083 RepID=UPI001E44C971|nr:hypothetical protein [Pontibacter harenae]MCC9165913.1 hypothetical protein [Pontibacter harenae]